MELFKAVTANFFRTKVDSCVLIFLKCHSTCGKQLIIKKNAFALVPITIYDLHDAYPQVKIHIQFSPCANVLITLISN